DEQDGEAGGDRGPALAGRGRRRTVTYSLRSDLEQLDLEDQRRPGLDLGRGAPVAVGELGRAHQPALAAALHELAALGPALDHLVEREGGWLAALDGAVEHGAVGERAVVVDLDRVGRLRRRPGPGLQRRDHQARGGLGRTLLGRGLLEEGLPRLLLDGGDGG